MSDATPDDRCRRCGENLIGPVLTCGGLCADCIAKSPTPAETLDTLVDYVMVVDAVANLMDARTPGAYDPVLSRLAKSLEDIGWDFDEEWCVRRLIPREVTWAVRAERGDFDGGPS